MSQEGMKYIPKDQLGDEALKKADELVIADVCFSRRTDTIGSEVRYSKDGREIVLRGTRDHGRFISVTRDSGDQVDAEVYLIRDFRNIKPILVDRGGLNSFLVEEMGRRQFT